MKMEFMGKTWEASNKISLVLAASNAFLVVLVLMMFYSIMGSKDRIVLTPPHMDRAMSVSWDSASEDYYKSWGLYLATLIGNITPSNVIFVTDTLSSYVDASIYKAVRVKLLALAKDERFAQSDGLSFFSPHAVSFEPSTSKVFVTGGLVYTTALSSNKAERPVVYEFVMETRDGRPRVLGLDSYESTEPHTLKWIEAHPAPAKQPVQE